MGYLIRIVLLVILCQTISASTAKKSIADPLRIEVSDPRPVAAAIIELEKKFGCVITYEDPAYLHTSQIEKSPEGQLIPKWGSISFNILESLLKEYSSQGNQPIFQVKKENGIYHVFPLKSKNINGELKSQVSILDTPISISAQNKNGAEILEMICDKLTEMTQKRVVVGTIPVEIFMGIKISYDFVKQSARKCLTTLLNDLGNNLSWQIFNDPKLQWYVVNIHYVPSP